MILKTTARPLCLAFACLVLSGYAISSGAADLKANLKVKADNPLIQINSFHFVGNNTQLAELCGKVNGPKSFYNLRVISDDGTNNPGDYHTTSGKTGNFCLVLSTYSGSAKVEIEE